MSVGLGADPVLLAVSLRWLSHKPGSSCHYFLPRLQLPASWRASLLLAIKP